MRIVRDPFVNFPSTTLQKIREEVRTLAEQFLRKDNAPTYGLDVVENLQDFLYPRVTIK